MVCRLAYGVGIVVAGRANACGWGRSRRMVEGCRGPGAGRFVAGIALRCSADVGRWFCLRVDIDITAAVAG